MQGTRLEPYAVSLVVDLLTPGRTRLAWRPSWASKRLFTARLLAGDMPHEIETVFQSAGLELFPNPSRDLSTSCSCPDSANPCKHIAAVYLLLGEVFDNDPFLLFRLRGLDRDQLIELLTGEQAPKAAPATALPEELPIEVVAFWGGPPPDNVTGEVIPPPLPAPVLHRLGGFPFWRGQTPIAETLAPLPQPPRQSEPLGGADGRAGEGGGGTTSVMGNTSLRFAEPRVAPILPDLRADGQQAVDAIEGLEEAFPQRPDWDELGNVSIASKRITQNGKHLWQDDRKRFGTD